MSFTIWFTGLSGAGKTTLSRAVYAELRRRGRKVEIFDGDLVRMNFSQELGYSRKDRDINVRRLGLMAHLLNKHGVISLVAAIAPYQEAREINRSLIGEYVEVYVKCPLDVLEARDTKGLYAKARQGLVTNLTGVSDPYEEPENSELTIRTDLSNSTECCAQIVSYLEERGLIPAASECDECYTWKEEDAAWHDRLAGLGFIRKPRQDS